MLNRKYALLAGAVLAATPLVGKAVTINFSYDANDLMVDGQPAVFGGTALAPTLTVSVGDIITLGVDVSVSGNANSTFAYHGAYDSTPATGTHHFIQPANLGLLSFGFGASDSNATAASMDPSGVSVDTGEFSTANATGAGDGAGGIGTVTAAIQGGLNPANITTSTAAGVAQAAYGAAGPAEIFNGLNIDATAAGTSIFTPNLGGPGTAAYAAYNSGGTTSTLKPVYKSVTQAATDIVTAAPALTVVVLGGSAATSAQPIITLTGSTLQGGTYGSQLGTAIHITGANGAYTTGNTGLQANPGQTTAFTATSTFTPGTDKEVYALKLDQGGTAISTSNTTLLNAIIADINSTSTTNPGNSGNITASLVTGTYTSLFPGYDILLTAPTGVGSTAYLGVDFSHDTTDAGVSVTEIAAVPEPATAAGIVLGAAGLLLGRRKNRVTVA